MNGNACKIDLYEISVKALQPETRKKLSSMLNRPKVLLSPHNYPRDYRGLGDLMGVNTLSIWLPDNDFVKNLLDLWARGNPGESNLGKLQEFLKLIDRYDVLDDTHEMFETDAAAYRSRPKKNASLDVPDEIRKDILTLADIDHYNKHKNLDFCTYDAFVLHVDADKEFAEKLITTLEGDPYHLHLCEKERDFVACIGIEREAIIQMIIKRCRKLLVVLSREFLESNSHTYYVQLTQSLTSNQSIASRVIPCIYKDCPSSDLFRAFHILDFRRANELVNFWEKLSKSIKPLVPNNKDSASEEATLSGASSTSSMSEPDQFLEKSKPSPSKKSKFSLKSMKFPCVATKDVSCPEEQNTVKQQHKSRLMTKVTKPFWTKINKAKAVAKPSCE